MIEHSFVNFIPQKERQKGDVCTAAIKSCCGCGEIIDSMGGGGLYMCKQCIMILSSGLLRLDFKNAKLNKTGK